MMPACNKGAGTNIGFPDVCNTIVGTATSPLPYPNIGANAQAAPFCVFTKVCMVAALNMQAKITMTSGMEAGTAHPLLKQPGAYTMGNPTIIIEKAPAVHLLCPTTGNNMNNALGAALVPSVVNVLFSHVREEQHSDDWLTPLDRALRDPACTAWRHRDVPTVGVLKPASLSLATSTRLQRALRRLVHDGAEKLLLDLRGHRGGDVRAALRLADDFLPAGTVLVEQHDRLGTVEHRARRATTVDLPLSVLVDRRTGSAAELLAGTLQHHQRATLIGEKTVGKWSAQALCATQPDGGLRYDTVARFSLPGQSPNGNAGLVPDVALAPARTTVDAQTQLLAAARHAEAEGRKNPVRHHYAVIR